MRIALLRVNAEKRAARRKMRGGQHIHEPPARRGTHGPPRGLDLTTAQSRDYPLAAHIVLQGEKLTEHLPENGAFRAQGESSELKFIE